MPRANQRETLYQLQSRWDDERARQRTDALRDQIAPTVAADRRWLPILIPLLVLLAELAAGVSRTPLP